MIDITNYETWFLLYADNELSAAEKEDVLFFVKQHPSLQQELNSYMEMRFSPAEEKYIDKSLLFSDSMEKKMQVALKESELLFDYMDGELSPKKMLEMNDRLKHDSNLRSSYEELIGIKLQSDQSVVYPNKDELYRRERPIMIGWRKPLVAAASLIIAAGLFWIFIGTNSMSIDPSMVVSTEKAPIQSKGKIMPEQQRLVTEQPLSENKKKKKQPIPFALKRMQQASDVGNNPIAESPSTEVAHTESTIALAEPQVDINRKPSNNLQAFTSSLNNEVLSSTDIVKDAVVVESFDGAPKKSGRNPFKQLTRKISRVLGKERAESDQIKFIQVANIQFAVSKQ